MLQPPHVFIHFVSSSPSNEIGGIVFIFELLTISQRQCGELNSRYYPKKKKKNSKVTESRVLCKDEGVSKSNITRSSEYLEISFHIELNFFKQ